MRTALAVFCLLASGLCAAGARPTERVPTDIPAQGLESALQLLAKERSIQVIYRSELVVRRRTSGVTGNLTALEALGKLLSGTGLTFRHLNDQTVTIVPAADPAAGVKEVERAMA